MLRALGINQTAFSSNVSKGADVLKDLCLSSRQTEGPTGPLYASSNPEYLSASDGESCEGFFQCLVSPVVIQAVQQYGVGVVFMEFFWSFFYVYTHSILWQCYTATEMSFERYLLNSDTFLPAQQSMSPMSGRFHETRSPSSESWDRAPSAWCTKESPRT